MQPFRLESEVQAIGLPMFEAEINAPQQFAVQSQLPILCNDIVRRVGELRVVCDAPCQSKRNAVFKIAPAWLPQARPRHRRHLDDLRQRGFFEGIELRLKVPGDGCVHACFSARYSKIASASLSAAVLLQFRMVAGLTL